MKLKIKIKVLTKGCEPVIIDKLKSSYGTKESEESKHFNVKHHKALIPLGVAMKLPDGFEAIVAPRSSSNAKFEIIQTNSLGVIDNSYQGNNDEWKMPILTTGKCVIKKGDRICQFRIQLSQKATILQKLKWLFSDGIELEFVDNLSKEDRNGFGSTGIK